MGLVRKILASIAALILSLSLSGCLPLGTSSDPASNSKSAEAYRLSARQLKEGFQTWQGSAHFAYRWATESEKSEIPCYSKLCDFIKVIADESCPVVKYRYTVLSNGQSVERKTDTLSTIDDPDAEFAPGIGFLTASKRSADSFELTEMTCVQGGSSSSSSGGGSSTGNQSVQTSSLIQVPDFRGYSTADVEAWVRSNGYSLTVSANTELGYNYDISCRMSNQDVVMSQSPSPGSNIDTGQFATILLNLNC